MALKVTVVGCRVNRTSVIGVNPQSAEGYVFDFEPVREEGSAWALVNVGAGNFWLPSAKADTFKIGEVYDLSLVLSEQA